MDLHAFEFCDSKIPTDQARLVVLFGDDAFLQGLAIRHLEQQLQGDSDEEASISEKEGRRCEWRDVADELCTVSLFGNSGRCVIIRDADEFVSENRGLLEDYTANPAKGSTLVLTVKSWPRNTRLAKAILKSGITVECRPPQRKAGRKMVTDTKQLVDWIIKRAKTTYQTKLGRAAAQQLLDLSGEYLGLIDQELAKLSLYTDGKQELIPEQIVAIVGGWRTQTTWDLLDAICDGNAKDSIRQLDHLLIAGEHPNALFGAFSWTLRKYAIATRFIERLEASGRRPNLQQALIEAGIHKFQVADAERRLRQIGRVRSALLLSWLVEADAQMKGSHSSTERARFVLEQLIFRLARQTVPPNSAAANR